MTNTTLPILIADAIDSENRESIVNLFSENPEQKSVHTFFGGQTWLGYAAEKGKLESAKTLLNIGLEVNAGDKREGSPAISSAAASGHLEIVDFLLKSGATMDVSTSVRNPLFAAIVGRSPKIVGLLLESGVDSKVRYNSKTMKEMDAVAFALMRGEAECARLIALWNSNGDEEAADASLAEADKIAEKNAR